MQHVEILLPAYNDWESLTLLLPRLDAALSAAGVSAEMLVVDDYSVLPLENSRLSGLPLSAIGRVRVLELSRNCGHQRAIALGLAFLDAEGASDSPVVVMDADGEDSPEDVPRLLGALGGGSKIIFAHRERRSEGPVFAFFYFVYRKLFAALIGRNVQFGNFSVIPRALLRRVASVSEIWNHYAIGVLKANIPYAAVPTCRAKRLAGRTHMNFVTLVMHGLSAIAIYGDVLGVRALIATALMTIPFACAAVAAVAVRLLTNLAIPGWATYVAALALILFMQFVTLTLFFVFLVLHGRNNASFLPRRDYHYFINGVRDVYPDESVHLCGVGAASLQLGV